MSETTEKPLYEKGKLYILPCDHLKTDESQPRKYFDPKKLEELSNTIKVHGVLQPILVRQDPDDGILYVVAGERRLRAARDAGLDSIPSVFVDGREEEIALIENLQREDLNPVELAEHLKLIMEVYEYKQDDLVGVISKAKSTISEILSLTDLPQDIREECRKDPNISRRTLLAIAKKKTTKEMRSAFDRYKMKHGNKGDNQPKKKIGKTSFDKLASKLHAVTNSLGKIDYQKTDETARRNLVSLIEEYNREISEILNKIKMMDNSNEA